MMELLGTEPEETRGQKEEAGRGELESARDMGQTPRGDVTWSRFPCLELES